MSTEPHDPDEYMEKSIDNKRTRQKQKKHPASSEYLKQLNHDEPETWITTNENIADK